MNSPLVSVITAAYNVSGYIAEAIISVKKQTYENWEMLIVDDNSTDDTFDIAQRFSSEDKRIRVFKLESHSGLPAAPRNFGIKNSRGEYIAFLDADDIWLPEKLEKQVKVLEEDRDAFLIYSKYILQENYCKHQIFPKKGYHGFIFNDLFLSNNFIPCLTVVMRNSNGAFLFDEDRRLKAIEDFDLWLTISMKKKISFINEPLAIYRAHGNNTSLGLRSFLKRYIFVIRKYRSRVTKAQLIIKYLSFYKFSIELLLVNCRDSVRRLSHKARNMKGYEKAVVKP